MTRSSAIFREEYNKTSEHEIHFMARARVIIYLSQRYKTYGYHRLMILNVLNNIDNPSKNHH